MLLLPAGETGKEEQMQDQEIERWERGKNGQYNGVTETHAEHDSHGPEPDPVAATVADVTRPTTPLIGMQIGGVNIFHLHGGNGQYCCGKIEADEEPMAGLEEDAMTEAVEVAGGQEDLVTITEFAAETGRSRQAVHQALPHIRHVVWRPKKGGQAVIFLYKADAEAWHSRRGRGRKKGHVPT